MRMRRREFLRLLSGRRHLVLTAVALSPPAAFANAWSKRPSAFVR
jgi:predicted house-cleaning NTP pyrophosphatase (Maf/HAM1 superfamily)